MSAPYRRVARLVGDSILAILCICLVLLASVVLAWLGYAVKVGVLKEPITMEDIR